VLKLILQLVGRAIRSKNMKAFFEQVPLCNDSSFLVREFNVPFFEAPLHFHPVYELTLIT